MRFRSIQLLTVALVSMVYSYSLLAAEFRSVNPEQVDMSSERLEWLDAALDSYVTNDQIAGQVVMVLREGRIVFSDANGWRDKEAGVPMTEDTIFRIASQTKAIVSTGIMVLQERGKLDINHPLSRYFPEWADVQVAVDDGAGGFTLEPARAPYYAEAFTHAYCRHQLWQRTSTGVVGAGRFSGLVLCQQEPTHWRIDCNDGCAADR